MQEFINSKHTIIQLEHIGFEKNIIPITDAATIISRLNKDTSIHEMAKQCIDADITLYLRKRPYEQSQKGNKEREAKWLLCTRKEYDAYNNITRAFHQNPVRLYEVIAPSKADQSYCGDKYLDAMHFAAFDQRDWIDMFCCKTERPNSLPRVLKKGLLPISPLFALSLVESGRERLGVREVVGAVPRDDGEFDLFCLLYPRKPARIEVRIPAKLNTDSG